MMKQCPKCKEMNGTHADKCFKCGTPFAVSDKLYQKLCPRCGLIFSSKAQVCEQCGGSLSVKYTPETGTQSNDYGGELRWWMILIAILWPLIGILVGFGIRSTYGDETGGRLIRFSLIVMGVLFGLGLLMGGCSVLLG